MNVEYYKDAQNVAEAIHNLQWNHKFENEEEVREERKRVRKKTLDFIVKWFDAVCEEEDSLLDVLLTLNVVISERVDGLFNEMIYTRRANEINVARRNFWSSESRVFRERFPRGSIPRRGLPETAKRSFENVNRR